MMIGVLVLVFLPQETILAWKPQSMEQNCKYLYFFLSHWSILQHYCPNYWPMLQLVHLVKHDVNSINQIPLIYFYKCNCILIVEITNPLTLVNNLQQGYKLDIILLHHIGNTPLLLLNMHMRFNCNIYKCMFCTLLCANIKLSRLY